MILSHSHPQPYSPRYHKIIYPQLGMILSLQPHTPCHHSKVIYSELGMILTPTPNPKPHITTTKSFTHN